MKEKKVRVGVIGTSWWADAMYLPALTSNPQAEVAAVCGRNDERTKAFGERWQVSRTFTDSDALIESGEIDAVVLASVNKFHY